LERRLGLGGRGSVVVHVVLGEDRGDGQQDERYSETTGAHRGAAILRVASPADPCNIVVPCCMVGNLERG